MFGQTGNPQFGFNASSQSSPFGQSAFGKTTATTTFGTATAPSVFGSNTSLFGSKTTSGPSSNVFGSTTNNPSFGANTVTQSFGEYLIENDRQRKVREGKRVYGCGHVLKCGKWSNGYSSNLKIEAQCLQSTHSRNSPFIVIGGMREICDAGQSAQRYHPKLVKVACKNTETDETSHPPIKTAKPRGTSLSQEKCLEITQIFGGSSPSMMVKSQAVRHPAIVVEEFSRVSERNEEVMKPSFEYQDSDLLEQPKVLKVNFEPNCCRLVKGKLVADGVAICLETRNWFAEWKKQREYRITGTSCYSSYTYVDTDKSPEDWEKMPKLSATLRFQERIHGIWNHQ
ncbi:hypothetical protein QAD02_002552 [Eretmocerus hayati]|uniref:Uncharacterized protein n=1 Tax=Eretmocerus hayati TaxID=131215 RepID=A0ACC2NK74_9HYME|nr:hypothetical protein QAD02_002552 [Eretmocerus hayati]